MCISGRLKDLIIHGGVNVSPRAVEEVLREFSGVKDAAVVGRPHPFWGEELVAYIIPNSVELDTQALSEFCRANLNTDSQPSEFISVKEFPRSSVGKVQKQMLVKSAT